MTRGRPGVTPIPVPLPLPGGWGAGSDAERKVCVPKIGLQFRASLVNEEDFSDVGGLGQGTKSLPRSVSNGLPGMPVHAMQSA